MNRHLLHPKLLLNRLAIIFLIYTICRIIFYLFNKAIFPSIKADDFILIMIYGSRFDISAILYTNLPFITLHLLPIPQRNSKYYQLFLEIMFYITNAVALFFTVIDFQYFRYSMKRSTADVAGFYFDFLNLLPQFLKDFWFVLLIYIGLLGLMLLLYKRIQKQTEELSVNYRIQSLVLLTGIALTILGARGGFQKKPISPITSLQYVDASNSALVTNTPFQFIHSLGHPAVELKRYFEDDKVQLEFNFCRKNKLYESGAPLSNPVNVLVIILESFTPECMGIYGAQTSYTPFLDSIGREGMVFRNMFANGTRSVEGIPAICASIPSLMDENFIYSPFQTNRLDGLGTLLKTVGYSTAFIHGGINGTFNFDSFSKLAGFDEYYGRNEYGEGDFDGNWGVYDGPFFQFAGKKISQMKEPFCSVLYSLSSHHPYHIPAEYNDMFSDIKDAYLKSVRYTDLCLKQFFEAASKESWFNNTLFVITADHKGPALNDYYYSWPGRYAIPLILFHVTNPDQGFTDEVVQQADILPGILDYINYPSPFCSFGQSFFQNTDNRYVYQYMSGTYQIIDGHYILHFDGTHTTAMYKYINGQHPGPDIKENFPQERERLENRLKAILQTYHSAMASNTLYYTSRYDNH